MNLAIPENMPQPPPGWIYAEGPLNHRAENPEDLLWWYGDEWATGNLGGAASYHYAVREGSPTAIANGLAQCITETEPPPTLKQIYGECCHNMGSIIILCDHYSSDGSKLMAKGILKKAVDMICADGGMLTTTSGMMNHSRWELAYNSKVTLFTLLAKKSETAHQIANRIKQEMRWNKNVHAIIPRHMGKSPETVRTFSDSGVKFHVL